MRNKYKESNSTCFRCRNTQSSYLKKNYPVITTTMPLNSDPNNTVLHRNFKLFYYQLTLEYS